MAMYDEDVQRELYNGFTSEEIEGAEDWDLGPACSIENEECEACQ